MKNLFIFLLVVFNLTLCFTNANAQNNNFTDAYNEVLKQRAMSNYPIEKWDSLRCVWYGDCAIQTAVQKQQTKAMLKSSCTLAKRMFGWHSIGTSSSNYVWQSISDLSYFSYDVNPSTGNAINSTQIANWATDATIVAAQNNGVNVNLCATLFNNTNEFSTFFGSSSAQSTLINNLVNAVVAANAKGINIDFEGSGLGSTYQSQFVSFMSSLSTKLHNTVANSELSIDLIGGYSSSTSMLTQLNSSVDLFIIMAYDYYWGGQGLPGPVAPTYNFYSSSYGSASNDLNNFLKVVVPNKVLLGMPYYGRRWGVSNACTLPGVGSGSSAISTQTYSQYKQNSNGYYSNPQRDQYTFNAYNCFTDGNSIPNQQFIDDVFSFQKKYNVIFQRNIAGGAVWRLGYDGGYSDLWNLINDNLSTCSVMPSTDTIYDMGGPLGNYHNSEDYTFTISPLNASSVILTFLSFDLETTNDYLKVYNGTSISSPLLHTLTGNSLPSAITAQSGAMTLQFHSNSSITKSGYEAVYTCGTGGGGQPDLTIINQSVSSSTVAAGSNITANCSEVNSGNATAATNIVKIYLSSDAVLTPGSNGDTYIDFIAFTSVSANSTSVINSKSIQIPNGTASGNYYLFFWADGGQVITESNESNNFATVQISVTASSRTYSVSTSSNPVVGGTTSGSGNYSSGQQATVLASSNSGYTFVNWSESGSSVTSNASYTFNITGNRSLVANFTDCSYTLSSNSVTKYSPAGTESFWVYTTSDCNWTATKSGCDWITFTNATGIGNGLVTFNLAENTNTTSRACTITVGIQTFTLTQNGYVAPCASAPSDLTFLSAGNIGSNQSFISWSGSSYNVTNCELERGLSLNGPFSLIASTGTNFDYTDITGIPGTIYYYRARACCNSNCSNYTNIDSILACERSTAPTGVTSSADSVCQGDSVLLAVEGGSVGTGAVWTWRFNNCGSGTFVGNGNTIKVAPTISGYYVIKPEGGSCVIPITCKNKYITVKPNPTASTIVASSKPTFCEGDSIFISGNIDGIWNNDATTSSINVKTSGDYFVTNTNACGSVMSNQILVTENPSPKANAGIDALICNGSSTQIGSTYIFGYTYNWTPTTGLSNAEISNPIAKPIKTTKYILSTKNSFDCASNDSVTVAIDQSCSNTCNPPVADFAASQTTGNCPFNVDFFDLSNTTGTAIYQWTIYNGGKSPVTSSLQNPTGILFNVAGNFLVKLQVTDSCGTDTKSATNYITVNCPVDITEISKSSNILIYPNPTSSILNIIGSEIDNGTYKLSLKNVIGQIILKDNFKIENNSIQKQFSISELANGIYFLSIESGKIRNVVKVVKQ